MISETYFQYKCLAQYQQQVLFDLHTYVVFIWFLDSTTMLRKRFYDAKVKRLRQSDNKNWWCQVKRFTGESKQYELSGLANSVASGSYRFLADIINESLQQVSEDLHPICEEYLTSNFKVPDGFIISAEMVLARLERINMYKAPGRDNLPNWVLRDFVHLLF